MKLDMVVHLRWRTLRNLDVKYIALTRKENSMLDLKREYLYDIPRSEKVFEWLPNSQKVETTRDVHFLEGNTEKPATPFEDSSIWRVAIGLIRRKS